MIRTLINSSKKTYFFFDSFFFSCIDPYHVSCNAEQCFKFTLISISKVMKYYNAESKRCIGTTRKIKCGTIQVHLASLVTQSLSAQLLKIILRIDSYNIKPTIITIYEINVNNCKLIIVWLNSKRVWFCLYINNACHKWYLQSHKCCGVFQDCNDIVHKTITKILLVHKCLCDKTWYNLVF